MNTYSFTKEQILNSPQTPGVYIFRDKNGKPIYVGKAKNLKNRLTSYIALTLSTKTDAMVHNAKTFSVIKVNSEFEALLLEAQLVKKYQPQYNIELKDDKSPLYIAITNEKYPRVLTLRQTQLEEFKLKHLFGPFIDSTSAKKVLRSVRRIIPYSQHKLGKRPCIYSELGLCNPCPNQIERETDSALKAQLTKAFSKNMSLLTKLLNGNIVSVSKELTNLMTTFSKNQQYEEASKAREALERLNYVTSEKQAVDRYIENPNFLSDIRNGETEALKKLLMPFFGEINLRRIECFDIAHLAGSSPTASMVVFIDGEAEKSAYRHFRIKKEKQNNDTESMREVLTRRMNHLEIWGTPDLIIVDGGRGQLSFAREVLGGKIPVIGLAKRYETIIVFSGGEFSEIRLPKGQAKNLMQRIRDEAHRFARRYHHTLVTKTLLGQK